MPNKKDKIYEDFTIEIKLADLSREGVRKQLFDLFLKEKGGHRDGEFTHATRYRYFVESSADGYRVFLKRPARLNKGIDIEVWVEKLANTEDFRPSHKIVLTDLRAKKNESSTEYKKLIGAITYVYNCKSVDEALAKYPSHFTTGFPPALILKIAKWLFIEQDLTYWNWEGRNMLMRGILSV